MTQEPEPTVVEWGSDRPERLTRVARLVRLDGPARALLARLAAGLGAAALFASFSTTWQVQRIPESAFPESNFPEGMPERPTWEFGLGEISAWAPTWVVGAMLLVAAVAVTLFGQPQVRQPARTGGLAGGLVLLAFLVAAGVDLGQRSIFTFETGIMRFGLLDDEELSLGPGWFLATASVLLLITALWLARTGRHAGTALAAADALGWREPAVPERRAGGPGDLTVAPAEPLAHPTDRHELR